MRPYWWVRELGDSETAFSRTRFRRPVLDPGLRLLSSGSPRRSRQARAARSVPLPPYANPRSYSGIRALGRKNASTEDCRLRTRSSFLNLTRGAHDTRAKSSSSSAHQAFPLASVSIYEGAHEPLLDATISAYTTSFIDLERAPSSAADTRLIEPRRIQHHTAVLASAGVCTVMPPFTPAPPSPESS